MNEYQANSNNESTKRNEEITKQIKRTLTEYHKFQSMIQFYFCEKKIRKSRNKNERKLLTNINGSER